MPAPSFRAPFGLRTFQASKPVVRPQQLPVLPPEPDAHWESQQGPSDDSYPEDRFAPDNGPDEDSYSGRAQESDAPPASALSAMPVIRTEGRDPLEVLSDIWGYSSFRPGQEEVVRYIVDGGDAMLLMPTSGGKSVCYQIPALVRPGMAVIVSPLIALMQDQVARLRECGIAAANLNSEISEDERRALVRDVRAGRIKLLYVSPERLSMESFDALLRSTPLALFAIDEAHCVSQWGHKFRKEYMRVGEVCSRFPGVPRIAVTATASPVTEADMKKNLHMQDARVFKSGFDRPNISYAISARSDSPLPVEKQLLQFVERHRGESGVVYCNSKKNCDAYSAMLRSKGFDSIPYHADVESATKKEYLERFIKGEAVVVCATIAFGMGIDKPDVRFVAHTGLPSSLEAYYQETGRAGRDGLPSEAWMVYSPADFVYRRDSIDKDSEHSTEYKKMALGRFNALSNMIEGAGCRRAAVLRYFGENPPERCGNCDRCLNPVATFDATRYVQMALSAVKRTGERYGAGHVVDVLLGARTERVASTGHDRLPTYGIGKDHHRDWWTAIMRQVLNAGYLEAPPHMNGGYRLTENGRQVLAGNLEVSLVEPQLRKGKGATGLSGARAVHVADDIPPERLALFEDLRAFRSRLARAQSLPPYAIFIDTTLIEIVGKMPGNLDELARVSGIGAAKLSRYGVDVLAIVARHRKASNVPDQIQLPGMGRR
jgi:ATP-dependent DNA helicase RecQ